MDYIEYGPTKSPRHVEHSTENTISCLSTFSFQHGSLPKKNFGLLWQSIPNICPIIVVFKYVNCWTETDRYSFCYKKEEDKEEEEERKSIYSFADLYYMSTSK